MGNDKPSEPYTVIGKNKFFEILNEVEDIIKKELNYNINEIINKISSFLITDDFAYCFLDSVNWKKKEEEDIDYLIIGNLESIEKGLFWKILFPLLKELKNLKNLKFENQLKLIFELMNLYSSMYINREIDTKKNYDCFKNFEEKKKDYINKYIKEKEEEDKKFLSIANKKKEFYYLKSNYIKFCKYIFRISLMFLFAKEELINFWEIIKNSDLRLGFLDALKIENEEMKKILDDYIINLEIFNCIEIENLKQIFILHLQSHIALKEEFKLNNNTESFVESLWQSIFLILFENNYNMKDNYLFIFLSSDNNYKKAISFKKNGKKNPSINLFKLKEQSKTNDKINIYQSLFNNEYIISFEKMSRKEIKKEIDNITKSNKDINLYIDIGNKIITSQEFIDSYLIKKIMQAKLFNLINMVKKEKNIAEQTFYKELIKKWRFLNFTKKLNRKLELMYKNFEHFYYQIIGQMVDEIASGDEIPNIENKEEKDLHKLNIELINEKKKNRILIGELNEMKKELKEIKIKNKKLEDKVNILQFELDNEKLQYKDLVEKIKDKEITMIKLEKNIKENLLKKDNEIIELKSKIEKYPFELKEGEEMITVIIKSFDENINYSLICKNTDEFYKIENEFYKTYSDYSRTNNIFNVKGKRINKAKNLKENNISNHDIIFVKIN